MTLLLTERDREAKRLRRFYNSIVSIIPLVDAARTINNKRHQYFNFINEKKRGAFFSCSGVCVFIYFCETELGSGIILQ